MGFEPKVQLPATAHSRAFFPPALREALVREGKIGWFGHLLNVRAALTKKVEIFIQVPRVHDDQANLPVWPKDSEDFSDGLLPLFLAFQVVQHRPAQDDVESGVRERKVPDVAIPHFDPFGDALEPCVLQSPRCFVP